MSLEEINEVFGDEVVVHLTHLTEEERKNLDMVIESDSRDPEKTTAAHVESSSVSSDTENPGRSLMNSKGGSASAKLLH